MTDVDSLGADTGLNDTGEMGGLTAHQYSDAETALSQLSQYHNNLTDYVLNSPSNRLLETRTIEPHCSSYVHNRIQ